MIHFSGVEDLAHLLNFLGIYDHPVTPYAGFGDWFSNLFFTHKSCNLGQIDIMRFDQRTIRDRV